MDLRVFLNRCIQLRTSACSINKILQLVLANGEVMTKKGTDLFSTRREAA